MITHGRILLSGDRLAFTFDGWSFRGLDGRSIGADALPRREYLAADCGRKTHCGKGEGVPLYDVAPGHPVDFRSRVAMVGH